MSDNSESDPAMAVAPNLGKLDRSATSGTGSTTGGTVIVYANELPPTEDNPPSPDADPSKHEMGRITRPRETIQYGGGQIVRGTDDRHLDAMKEKPGPKDQPAKSSEVIQGATIVRY